MEGAIKMVPSQSAPAALNARNVQNSIETGISEEAVPMAGLFNKQSARRSMMYPLLPGVELDGRPRNWRANVRAEARRKVC